jgi:hypothetical protein
MLQMSPEYQKYFFCIWQIPIVNRHMPWKKCRQVINDILFCISQRERVAMPIRFVKIFFPLLTCLVEIQVHKRPPNKSLNRTVNGRHGLLAVARRLVLRYMQRA